MKRTLFASLICLSTQLLALPSSGEVISGNATIAVSNPKSIHVEAQGKAIIHWQQFNINHGEKVSFHQSQPQMAVLSRVTGGSASQILGKLDANCPIYLVNGSGVFIGSRAQISTAGFLASTADITNESFLSQKELTFHQLQEGNIVNLGTITCPTGNVTFIARSIENPGTIHAPEGKVTLNTTEMVLHPNEKKQVFIRPDQTTQKEGITNQGIIEAQEIHLETSSPYAQAINHTGEIKAYRSAEKNGRILLVAHQGGIECKGTLKSPAGTIDIQAKDIAIKAGSLLETSSQTTGGAIALAGTHTTQVEKGAQLCAKSGPQGDKGRASILTKQGTFTILGDVHADETLYDPKFVNIQPGGTNSAINNTFNNGVDTATISGASLQSSLNSGNVIIQADTDITFNDTVNATTSGNGLTLQAGRSISFSLGDLTLNGGDFSATINHQDAVDRDAGVATFSMIGLSFLPSTITTNGGNVSINVGTYGSQQEGEIHLASSQVDVGGGRISLTGYGRLDATNNVSGIVVSDYSKLQASESGTITLTGTGGNGASGCHGVYLPNSMVSVESENGTITITGTGGGGSTGNMNSGVIHAGALQTTGNGNIQLTGTAIEGVDLNTGVCFVSGGSASVVDGKLIIQGTVTGTGNKNYGVRLESESSCSSSGSGQIQLIGSSSGGVENNQGVVLSNGHIKSATGAVLLQGDAEGTDNYNHGVRLESMAYISTDTATITIQGDNNGGIDANCGVSISSDQKALLSDKGDITIIGTSAGTGKMNQGLRVDGGSITSTGTGASAANISLTGTGSPIGTDSSGVFIRGYQVAVTSIDGDITITGSASGDNAAYTVDTNVVEATGTGSVTYDPPQP